MAFEDDLKRRLRRLADELERGGNDMLPGTAAGRRPPKLRKGAAGIGLAACIAAIVALVAQIVPSERTGTRDTRPAAAPTTEQPAPESPTPEAAISTPPKPPDSYPHPPTAIRTPPAPPPSTEFDCRDPGPRGSPPNGIRITAEVQPANPAAGSPVRVVAHFKNERATPARNEQGRPFVDFLVFDEAEQVVWNPYPKDAVWAQDLRVKDYAPGEEDSEALDWNTSGCGEGGSQSGPRLARGRYTIRAFWSGNLGGWSEPVSFEIR